MDSDEVLELRRVVDFRNKRIKKYQHRLASTIAALARLDKVNDALSSFKSYLCAVETSSVKSSVKIALAREKEVRNKE